MPICHLWPLNAKVRCKSWVPVDNKGEGYTPTAKPGVLDPTHLCSVVLTGQAKDKSGWW